MKKKLILLGLALPFQGYASPATVMEQLNRGAWKTDHLSVDEAVQADEKGAMQDIVQGLNQLPKDVRESIIDPMLSHERDSSHGGSFLGHQFEMEHRNSHMVRRTANLRAIRAYTWCLRIGNTCTVLNVAGLAQRLLTGGTSIYNAADRLPLLKLSICAYGVGLVCLLYPHCLSTVRRNNPFNRHLTAVQDILLSEDGNYFVSISDDKSLLWDSRTHKCLGKFSYRPEVEQRFMSLKSLDGYQTLLVSPRLGQLYLTDGKGLQYVDESRSDFTAASYTQDGKKIIAGGKNGSIHIYEQPQLLKEAFDGKPTRSEQRKQERKRRKKQIKWGLAAAGAAAGAAYAASYLWNSNK